MSSNAPDITALIARTALRDRQAFRQLYRLTSAKLFGVSLRILKDRAEAEEALQEVYVKIWRRSGGEVEPRLGESWNQGAASRASEL